MDNYISSFPDTSKALSMYFQMVSLFKSGGFEIVKWISILLDFF